VGPWPSVARPTRQSRFSRDAGPPVPAGSSSTCRRFERQKGNARRSDSTLPRGTPLAAKKASSSGDRGEDDEGRRGPGPNGRNDGGGGDGEAPFCSLPESVRLRLPSPNSRVFKFVWLDYCGFFSGYKGRLRQIDVQSLLHHKFMASPSLLAITTSQRGGQRELYPYEGVDNMILFVKRAAWNAGYRARVTGMCAYMNVAIEAFRRMKARMEQNGANDRRRKHEEKLGKGKGNIFTVSFELFLRDTASRTKGSGVDIATTGPSEAKQQQMGVDDSEPLREVMEVVDGVRYYPGEWEFLRFADQASKNFPMSNVLEWAGQTVAAYVRPGWNILSSDSKMLPVMRRLVSVPRVTMTSLVEHPSDSLFAAQVFRRHTKKKGLVSFKTVVPPDETGGSGDGLSMQAELEDGVRLQLLQYPPREFTPMKELSESNVWARRHQAWRGTTQLGLHVSKMMSMNRADRADSSAHAHQQGIQVLWVYLDSMKPFTRDRLRHIDRWIEFEDLFKHKLLRPLAGGQTKLLLGMLLSYNSVFECWDGSSVDVIVDSFSALAAKQGYKIAQVKVARFTVRNPHACIFFYLEIVDGVAAVTNEGVARSKGETFGPQDAIDYPPFVAQWKIVEDWDSKTREKRPSPTSKMFHTSGQLIARLASHFGSNKVALAEPGFHYALEKISQKNRRVVCISNNAMVRRHMQARIEKEQKSRLEIHDEKPGFHVEECTGMGILTDHGNVSLEREWIPLVLYWVQKMNAKVGTGALDGKIFWLVLFTEDSRGSSNMPLMLSQIQEAATNFRCSYTSSRSFHSARRMRTHTFLFYSATAERVESWLKLAQH